MQLDSHHRFVKGWDTKTIKMLHSCDAGEYSVLTTYGAGFAQVNLRDSSSYTKFSEPIIEANRMHMF